MLCRGNAPHERSLEMTQSCMRIWVVSIVREPGIVEHSITNKDQNSSPIQSLSVLRVGSPKTYRGSITEKVCSNLFNNFKPCVVAHSGYEWMSHKFLLDNLLLRHSLCSWESCVLRTLFCPGRKETALLWKENNHKLSTYYIIPLCS